MQELNYTGVSKDKNIQEFRKIQITDVASYIQKINAFVGTCKDKESSPERERLAQENPVMPEVKEQTSFWVWIMTLIRRPCLRIRIFLRKNGLMRRRKLCILAGVKKGNISWYGEKKEDIFSW